MEWKKGEGKGKKNGGEKKKGIQGEWREKVCFIGFGDDRL